MANYKRKKKLVHRAFQLKLIGIFLAISCLAATVQVMFLSRSFMAAAEQLEDGDRLRMLLPGVLSGNLASTVWFLLPAMLLVGLTVTHRVAGPAFRINRYLRQVAESGEASEPCGLRKGDELSSLVSALNAAIDRIQSDKRAALESSH